jgi:hypothetical protein
MASSPETTEMRDDDRDVEELRRLAREIVDLRCQLAMLDIRADEIRARRRKRAEAWA